MFNQRYSILFIDRNKFYLSGGGVTNVVVLEVPDTIVHDLDVVQKDGLYTLVKQWVKQYALAGTQLVVIFSTTSYFEKLLNSGESTEVENEVLKFFDVVPFDMLWTKVYQDGKTKRAVAVNKTLYDALHQGFLLQGVPLKTVVPACVLGDMSKKTVLDSELVQYILRNIDTITKQSLQDTADVSSKESELSESVAKSGKKNANLPMLMGVFGVLILVLIFVFLRMR